ncbi:MAG: DUF2017 family protein [Actinomycetales bacterium]|nr:DUF2017 family protein [Actinomycetales bacterium]
MSSVALREGVIQVDLSPTELGLLRTVLEQFATVARDDADPAAGRLYPDGYRDDPDAAAQFRRLTRSDLRDRKLDAAGALLAALAEGSPIVLGPEDAGRWLPVLTDVRIVLAQRLGVLTDDDRPEGLMADVYHWAGELQALLVEALDALDDGDPRDGDRGGTR